MQGCALISKKTRLNLSEPKSHDCESNLHLTDFNNEFAADNEVKLSWPDSPAEIRNLIA